MKVFGYLRVVGLTTLNIVANGATLGRYVWLEGRVEGAVSLGTGPGAFGTLPRSS